MFSAGGMDRLELAAPFLARAARLGNRSFRLSSPPMQGAPLSCWRTWAGRRWGLGISRIRLVSSWTMGTRARIWPKCRVGRTIGGQNAGRRRYRSAGHPRGRVRPAYDAGFIWDDDGYVIRHSLLRSLDALRRSCSGRCSSASPDGKRRANPGTCHAPPRGSLTSAALVARDVEPWGGLAPLPLGDAGTKSGRGHRTPARQSGPRWNLRCD